MRPRLGGLDSGAGVLDFHGHALGSLSDRPEEDAAPARRELHRVLQDVPENLAEADRIGAHRDLDEGAFPLDEDPTGCGFAPADLDDLVERLRQRHRNGDDAEVPAGDPRQVQQVLDQLRLQLRVAPHDLDLRARFRRQGSVLLEHRGEREDRGQRRPQLVGERREETVLRLVRPLGLLLSAPAFRRRRSEHQKGSRGQGHERLELEEARLDRVSNERAMAAGRRPDGDRRNEEHGPGRAALLEAKGRPDQEGRQKGRHRLAASIEEVHADESQRHGQAQDFPAPGRTIRGDSPRSPGEEHRCDDEISDGVSQPPGAPRGEDPLGDDRAGENQAPHSDRRADGGAAHGSQEDQRQDVGDPIERAAETRDASQRIGGEDGFERVAGSDSQRGGQGRTRPQVGDDGAERDARPESNPQEEERRQRQSGRGPDERREHVDRMERETEAGEEDVGRGEQGARRQVGERKGCRTIGSLGLPAAAHGLPL